MSIRKKAPRLHLQHALALAALGGVALLSTGCIQDSECGICDPDNLILESISGVNYASDKVHILNPTCDNEGGGCPDAFTKGTYFIDEIGPCEESDDAIASANPEEFCKLSPLVTAFGIEFVFNNLLDPQSLELVRKRPDNPQLFEVYDWKPDVLRIEGPITRFNGDYNRGAGEAAHTMTRMVNLSCIDNLAAAGVAFDNTSYEDPATNPCNTFANGMPQKMALDSEVKGYRGQTQASGEDCSAPEGSPNTCCTFCQWLLTTKVDRYGVTTDGVKRGPDNNLRFAPALDCTPEVEGTPSDVYARCNDFVISTDRSDEEQEWEYAWCADFDAPASPTCEMVVGKHPIALADKLRETHPDRRPTGLENLTSTCSNSAQCDTVHNLPGTDCMGTHADTGATCLMDAFGDSTCTAGVCRPQWMVGCSATTNFGGEVSYCQDRRFTALNSAACKAVTPAVNDSGGYQVGCDADGTNCIGSQQCQCVGQDGGCSSNLDGEAFCRESLALCDWNEDGRVSPTECCSTGLNGGADPGENCDPFFQENLVDVPLYQRDINLPTAARSCVCPAAGQSLASQEARLKDEGCYEPVQGGCYGDDESTPILGRENRYAIKFVRRPGGVIYDPAIKGFEWRPADLGGTGRAAIERCAENNTGAALDDLNRHDGWRANDPFIPETREDFDRAMCSGQEYKVIFNDPGNPDNPSFVEDKAGNTLQGKSVYTFETSQFHIQPNTGFPPDNLRIGACDEFSLRFSNKFDMGPENLNKIQLFRLECDTDDSGARTCDRAPERDTRCENGTPESNATRCCIPAAVAGGEGCFSTKAALEASDDPCAAPCLTIDIEQQDIGQVAVQIDPTEFQAVLEVGEVYSMEAPTLGNLGEAEDPAKYKDVFWDVCGMPLLTDNAIEYTYEFKVDQPKCSEDEDRDDIPLSCDNAPKVSNPKQEDLDRDGVGDIVDLCPTIPGTIGQTTADADNDGIGNDCDSCRRTAMSYNEGAPTGMPSYMFIRNIPDQTDTDEDGIGDVCDNCVQTANCENYGIGAGLTEYTVGLPIAYADFGICQTDGDLDLVGDACSGDATVGLGPEDDFDGDGLANIDDNCPRQPNGPTPVVCSADPDCPGIQSCVILAGETEGVCNHTDTDGDGVGDACDTCIFAPNPSQVQDGGAQEDDPDGDFVGTACETHPDCSDVRKDPRPFAFHPVAALGSCCVAQLIEAQQAYEDTDIEPNDLLIASTCIGNDLATCTRLTTPHPDEGREFEVLPVRRAGSCPDFDDQGNKVEGVTCARLPIEKDDAIPDAEGVLTPRGLLLPPEGCEEPLQAWADTVPSLMGQTLTIEELALANLLNPLSDNDFNSESNPFDALWGNMCFLPQRDQDFDGIGDSCDLCINDFDPTNRQYVNRISNKLFPDAGHICSGPYNIDKRCEAQMVVVGGGNETDGGGNETDGGETDGGETDGGETGG